MLHAKETHAGWEGIANLSDSLEDEGLEVEGRGLLGAAPAVDDEGERVAERLRGVLEPRDAAHARAAGAAAHALAHAPRRDGHELARALREAHGLDARRAQRVRMQHALRLRGHRLERAHTLGDRGRAPRHRHTHVLDLSCAFCLFGVWFLFPR